MQFVLAHSSHARLPERADVLLSDQIGQFGFEAGLVQTVADVRTRLLKPGGRIVPERVTLFWRWSSAAVARRPELLGSGRRASISDTRASSR